MPIPQETVALLEKLNGDKPHHLIDILQAGEMPNIERLADALLASVAEVAARNATQRQLRNLAIMSCALDPCYFIDNFVYIRTQPDLDDDDEDEGQDDNLKRSVGSSSQVTLQKLWPKQRELIEALQVYLWVIAGKSRKVGFTTTGIGFALWKATFNEFSRSHLFSRRDDAARNMLTRVKFSWRRLPPWLRLPAVESNAHTLSLRGPKGDERAIQAYPTIEDSGIEETADFTMLDEFASLKEPMAGKFWSAVEPSIAPNGQLFILSRGKGPQGTFANLFRQALANYGMAYDELDEAQANV